jgi:hypothetical protein
MKVYLIMWVCMQQASLPLNDTCKQTTLLKTYATTQECIVDVKKYATVLIEDNDKLYATGFCTTKSFT